MARIRPIRSEEDYQAALVRIEAIMDARPGDPEGEELDVLVDLVELHESKQAPMGYPSPIAAIEFRMERHSGSETGGRSSRLHCAMIGSTTSGSACYMSWRMRAATWTTTRAVSSSTT